MNYQLVQAFYPLWEKLINTHGPVVVRSQSEDFLFALYANYKTESLYFIPDEEGLVLRLLSEDSLVEAESYEDYDAAAFLNDGIELEFNPVTEYSDEEITNYVSSGYDVEKVGKLPMWSFYERYTIERYGVLTEGQEEFAEQIIQLLMIGDNVELIAEAILEGLEGGALPILAIDEETGEIDADAYMTSFPDINHHPDIARIFLNKPDKILIPELPLQRSAREIRQFEPADIEVQVDFIPSVALAGDDEPMPLVLLMAIDEPLQGIAFDMRYRDAYVPFIQEQFIQACLEHQVCPRCILTTGMFDVMVQNILTPIAQKFGATIESLPVLPILDDGGEDDSDEPEDKVAEMLIHTINNLPKEEQAILAQHMRDGGLTMEDFKKLLTLNGMGDLLNEDDDE